MISAMKLARKISILISCVVVLVLSACKTQSTVTMPTITERVVLTPYVSPSSTITPQAPTETITPLVVPSQTPTTSPTPFVYTVQKGDTLGGLALRYGSTVSAIEDANPGIDPNILTVGMTLIIPVAGPNLTPTIIPTPAPLTVTISQPTCYSAADGGAWCLSLVSNELSMPVENISAWISLQSSVVGGADSSGAVAFPPLNLLLPGQQIPINHYFSPPLPRTYVPQVEILTALPAVITTTRYISSSVQIDAIEIGADGLFANADGQVSFNDDLPVKVLTLAMIAYDSDDQPVGIGKWEVAGEPLPASGVPFSVQVYSLGPEIVRVEILSEAIPLVLPTDEP